MDAVRGELEALRAAMAPLEPGPDERGRLAAMAVAHAEGYLSALPDGPSNYPWDDAFARPLHSEFPEHGRDPAETLEWLGECVDRPGITTASPRFLGYIPGGGLYHSALGDFLAATANKYSGFASASPGGVRMENAVTRWIADVIGYPATAAGTLTSGGSLANLTAIVAAREAADADDGGAVYATRYAHYCVDKALLIAGRAKAPRRSIAVDERFRMSLDSLRDAIERDLAAGVRPWLVVASAGTVDTGSVDPLADIASLCERHGVWLHVDGAYGGLFALCEEGRAMLGGIERADSVALDPHKTLFLPYGTGAVLARDGQKLLDAFSASADYIRPLGESEVGPSPADLSPELTRHFRALRLWLPLQLAGVAAFRAAQSEKIKLARYFHALLSEIEGFEALAPDLSVVAFRYVPKFGDANAFNDRLLRHMQQEGRVFFSGTRLEGRAFLRAAISSFRTHLQHIDEALDVLRRGVAMIEASQ